MHAIANEELGTKLKFEFGSDRSHKRLVNHVLELDWDTPVLWVDDCLTINQGAGKKGLCVLVAKPGAEPIINSRIDGSMEIPIEDLKKVIGLQTKPRGNQN